VRIDAQIIFTYRDADARRYADQKEEMAIIVSNYKKMQLLVESYRAQMKEQEQ